MPPPTYDSSDDHAERVSEELAKRMTRLQQTMERLQPACVDAGKSKSEAVNLQPEYLKKQEEQDAPLHLRPG